jgi:thymidylate kinase
MTQLIVFEGPDGAGKSTLAKAVATELNALLLSTPGRDFDEIRPRLEDLYKDHADSRQLFYLSTVVRCSDKARSALEAGQNVVIDRYLPSTQVYAQLRGPHLLLDELAKRLIEPDLCVFLDCADHERKRRMQRRESFTDEDERSLADAPRLRALYQDYFQRSPLVGHLLNLDSTSTDVDTLVRQIVRQLERPWPIPT